MVESPDTILAAFDAGINFFFVTADMHWPWYEGTRRGLIELLARGKVVREQIVVAVVAYVTQPEFCTYPFAEALEAITGLRTIDVLVAGGVYAREFPIRLPVFQEHRKSKYLGARAIGATFHERQAVVAGVNDRQVDIAFIRYNAIHPGAQKDVFPQLKPESPTLLFNFKNTQGSMSREQFVQAGLAARGLWQPSITDYYRFVLSRPEFHGILMAPNTPTELSELAEAIDQGPLSPDDEEYMIDLSRLAAAGGRTQA
jgi:hypothetical protein